MDFGDFIFTPAAVVALLIGTWTLGLGAGAVAVVLAGMRGR